MRIQDLETRTGLERATIRFYERQELINPKRTENGYREYSEEEYEQLMKIKLLRQLGLSVGKIKDLQQGREDFSTALEQQIETLSRQIEENRRAKEICEVIRTAEVNYQTMDAEYYLKLLREKPINLKQTFREDVPKEIHPVRRFVARLLDLQLFSGLVQFILYVILRIRPLPQDVMATVIAYVTLFLYIPVEAWMIHNWGTTPGKWVMGIRIESAEGGKLTYFYALCRTWEVFRYGIGFNIPIWSWICTVRCFCRLTGRSWRPFIKYNELEGPSEMEWDRDAEITYSQWERKGMALTGCLVCVLLALNTITVLDCLRPRYRGSDLTIAEFAANYNSYVSMIDRNMFDEEKLQPDGTWQPKASGQIIVDLTGTPNNESASFTYETEEGYVRSVTYVNSWSNILLLSPLSGKCANAAVSIASAQDWFNLYTFYDFVYTYNQETSQDAGQFRYENIEVIWNMDIQNCEITDSGYLIPTDESAPTSVDFNFQVIIYRT